MGKIFLFLLVFSFILTGSLCYSQTSFKVSDPRLEMVGNTIHIVYDILNSTPSEEFTVELVVKDSEGNVINARALSGDVGDLVTGGKDKHITWDLEVDRIEMNADIYVKVHVKAIPPPEPAVVVPPAVQEDGEKSPEEIPVATSREEQYSRTGLILQSVAFPGLGLSRYKGGPHWTKGVLGYGCIVGSLIMNRVAVSTYDGIIDRAGYDAKNTLYQKSLQQDQISEVLAYTAIAIWVSDLVWTIAGTSDLNKRTSSYQGLRINPTIDPVSNMPLIAFTYKF